MNKEQEQKIVRETSELLDKRLEGTGITVSSMRPISHKDENSYEYRILSTTLVLEDRFIDVQIDMELFSMDVNPVHKFNPINEFEPFIHGLTFEEGSGKE